MQHTAIDSTPLGSPDVLLDSEPKPGGKNLEVFSATIGRLLLERGLIDEIDLHIAPVLLGDGIQLFDNLGGGSAAVNVRYHPVATK